MPNLDDVIKGLLRCQECDCDECCLDHASKASFDCPAKDNLIDPYHFPPIRSTLTVYPVNWNFKLEKVHDCAKMFRRDDV